MPVFNTNGSPDPCSEGKCYSLLLALGCMPPSPHLLVLPVEQVVDTLLMLAEGGRPSRYPESAASPEAGPGYRLLIHVTKIDARHLVWSVDVDRHTCT